jgi:hypothetical protein
VERNIWGEPGLLNRCILRSRSPRRLMRILSSIVLCLSG